MKFIAAVCDEFFARHSPVSTAMNPNCMNITRQPPTITHTMLIEYKLWATAVVQVLNRFGRWVAVAHWSRRRRRPVARGAAACVRPKRRFAA